MILDVFLIVCCMISATALLGGAIEAHNEEHMPWFVALAMVMTVMVMFGSAVLMDVLTS